MKDTIKMKDANSGCYDKMQIALAIRNSTVSGELGCSVLRQGILKSCDSCELKKICKYIEDAAEKYTKDTTIMLQEFKF